MKVSLFRHNPDFLMQEITMAKRPFKPARVAPGSDNPLNAALGGRSASTLDMVRDAIAHKQCLLAFQPVMMSSDTSRTAFHEGLIRVMDDTGRVIPAGEFMPVVEDTELGREIDTLALNMGLRALHEVPDLRLSINMSARSIGFQKWTRTLERWLANDATLGERLILEITERSAMTVPELVTDFMDRLQKRGICFALDDFGAGQTALRYFKDFFFDVLKIDGQFITGIAHSPDNQALVRSMLSIARHFDMIAVAEFVETQDDADCLTQMGVDCMQGYLFGAPSIKPAWLVHDQRLRAAG